LSEIPRSSAINGNDGSKVDLTFRLTPGSRNDRVGRDDGGIASNDSTTASTDDCAGSCLNLPRNSARSQLRAVLLRQVPVETAKLKSRVSSLFTLKVAKSIGFRQPRPSGKTRGSVRSGRTAPLRYWTDLRS
jgi:hypothetical protein